MDSHDNLIIDTPEQTSLEFPLAGIGSRFLAMAADTAIQAVGGLVILIVLLILLPGFKLFGMAGLQWVLALFIIAGFLLYSAYFAFFEIVWNGQTPGKRYAQLRVMKDDGRPISAYDAIARNLLRIVDSFPGFYGVGILSVFFSKQSKRLGDFVAGTVVVHETALEGVRPFAETKIDESLPAFDASNITVDELRLIETFIQRRDGLDPALRGNMALQIAGRIGEKLQVKVYGWPRTETFLEAVLKQCRERGQFRNQ
jgi:uncharacterized RDD family membrane protein YckC